MLALAALVLHANFRQNAAGCGIVFEVGSEDAVQSERVKTITNHFVGGFRGVSVSPERYAKPIAQLGVLMVLLDAKADASDLAAVAAQCDGQPEFVGIFRQLEKSFCVLFRVRVSDAQSGRG